MRKALLVLSCLLFPALAMAQNTPPVADAGPDQTIFVGELTLLQGSATDVDGDTIDEWLWAVDSAPEGSSPVIFGVDTPDPAFTADVGGDYVLSLIVSDGIDWSLPDYVTIHVYQILPPEAVINADVTAGPAPLTVQFDASGSFVDPYADPLTYDWNFGDGSYSSEVTPTHTYEDGPGTYTAVLTVVDNLGQYDSDVIEITVEEPLAAWGEASVVGMDSSSPAKGLNWLIALLVPVGAVLFWKGLRKRR